MVMWTLRDEQKTPTICAACGEPSSRRHEVRRERRDADASVPPRGFFFDLLIAPRIRPMKAISVQLPLCATCAPPEPEHVDFDRLEMKFRIHRNLRGAMRGDVVR